MQKSSEVNQIHVNAPCKIKNLIAVRCSPFKVPMFPAGVSEVLLLSLPAWKNTCMKSLTSLFKIKVSFFFPLFSVNTDQISV